MIYSACKKEAGEGIKRINNPMLFREDMYSLLFIANLKPKYKKACEEKAQEDEDKMD